MGTRGGDQGGVEGAKAPPEKFRGGFYIKKPPHKFSPEVEKKVKYSKNRAKITLNRDWKDKNSEKIKYFPKIRKKVA